MQLFFEPRIKRIQPQILTSKSEVKTMEKNNQNKMNSSVRNETTNSTGRKKSKANAADSMNRTDSQSTDCK